MPQSTEPGHQLASLRRHTGLIGAFQYGSMYRNITGLETRMRNALHKAAALLLFSVLLVAHESSSLEPSPPQIVPTDI
jgi:hypothetical protein